MIKLIKTLEEILEIFDFANNGVEDYEDLSLKDRLTIANSFSELTREVNYLDESEHRMCDWLLTTEDIEKGLSYMNPLCTNFTINQIQCSLIFVDNQKTPYGNHFINPRWIIIKSEDTQLNKQLKKLLCCQGRFELLYTKAREAYAQQIYEILTKPQRLRILHYPQLGANMEPFEVYVNNLLEAYNTMNTLANYDLYQYDNRIKPDYCSCQMLEVWDDIDKEWSDWIDEDFWTNDVSVLVDRYEEYKFSE